MDSTHERLHIGLRSVAQQAFVARGRHDEFAVDLRPVGGRHGGGFALYLSRADLCLIAVAHDAGVVFARDLEVVDCVRNHRRHAHLSFTVKSRVFAVGFRRRRFKGARLFQTHLVDVDGLLHGAGRDGNACSDGKDGCQNQFFHLYMPDCFA